MPAMSQWRPMSSGSGGSKRSGNRSGNRRSPPLSPTLALGLGGGNDEYDSGFDSAFAGSNDDGDNYKDIDHDHGYKHGAIDQTYFGQEFSIPPTGPAPAGNANAKANDDGDEEGGRRIRELSQQVESLRYQLADAPARSATAEHVQALAAIRSIQQAIPIPGVSSTTAAAAGVAFEDGYASG